jgi:hypothetical protein
MVARRRIHGSGIPLGVLHSFVYERLEIGMATRSAAKVRSTDGRDTAQIISRTYSRSSP